MHPRSYHDRESSNVCSGSTTWHFACGSLDGPGGPLRQSRPAGASIYELHSRDPRRPLDLQIRYIGGAEGLWLIQARNWRWRFSGGLSVVDVMNWVNRCDT